MIVDQRPHDHAARSAGHPYDRDYYDRYDGTPYDRDHTQWLEFFGAIARQIVADIGPRRVLDAGCAKGFLVEALRDRGVDALGIDLSEYAISEVRPDIRSFCRAGSLVEPIDGHYDLITCIEVLEHLTEEEGRLAIANICRSTGDVLFSSSPDAFDDPTHLNVRPRSYWIERFAEHGFRLDVDYDAGFVSPQAMRFRNVKTDEPVLDALLIQRHRLLREIDTLESSAAEKDRQIAGLRFQLLAIEQSAGWRMLGRLRRLRDALLPERTRRREAYWALRRVVTILRSQGLRACLTKVARKAREASRLRGTPWPGPAEDLDAQYQRWIERHRPPASGALEAGRAGTSFRYMPLVSIVTPVYDPDETWLRKAIDSVRGQLYPRWELCLVNDGSKDPRVREVLDEYAAAEPRIKVKHLAENGGIVSASNQALSLATGEFVGLMDHDDELSSDALLEVVAALNADRDLDLLYSDEDKLELDGRRVEPFFKPGWSPDLLLSMNYINHFTVFRRRLLAELGGFRLGFDGSQDYDLLLRVTEQTRKIGHIPKVLYHWRKVPGSTAATATAKTFAYGAGRRAIEDALGRRAQVARVEGTPPGRYRVRYTLRGAPLVSIIIPTRDRRALLEQCVRSIEERTVYPRYEIIVLDNGSADPETLEYLHLIGKKWRVFEYPGPFNFSALNNFGVAKASGEQLLFLNNDIQVIAPEWLEEMVGHAERADVGVVGAKLLYPDERIQHAGVVLGVGGVAGHAFKRLPGTAPSYFDLADQVRNCTAVTAACMMVPRRVFDEVGGFDERLRVAFNDVDLCLRIRQRGYLVVYTPLARLYHHESATRGTLHPPEDEALMWERWGESIRRGDPYYNPNLTLASEDWGLRV